MTGVVEEEEMESAHRLRRRTARGSVDNVMTVIRKYLGIDPRDYDIHLNFREERLLMALQLVWQLLFQYIQQ